MKLLKNLINHRKRKTQDPCLVCYMHKERCICESIPKFNLRTKVVLVIHTKELAHTTNTGRLALASLSNSEMRVRGLERSRLDLSDLLIPEYRSVLFYPTIDSIELTESFVNESELPIQLIVPDGSWRQAAKVAARHHELSHIPRVKISALNLDQQFMRKETSEAGMATLQAIALALGMIEGQEVKQKLMDLYVKKLEATLRGRGMLKNI
jgi:DTW domain-containing protein YfiP